MTTGFWLLIAWSLGAIVVSILPVVLLQFGISDGLTTSIASAGLGIFILAVICLAPRRDIRMLRLVRTRCSPIAR